MMGERLKKLRENLKFTQQEFADRLKIKRGTLASYEINRNEPIDAVIALICLKFNVNEAWLRTGEGNMFVAPNAISFDEFAKKHNATDLEMEILRAYFELDPDIRQKLISHFKSRFSNATNEQSASTETNLYDEIESLQKRVGAIEQEDALKRGKELKSSLSMLYEQ